MATNRREYSRSKEFLCSSARNPGMFRPPVERESAEDGLIMSANPR